MNKLEELIKQLCPEGVEFKKFKKIAESISTGKLNANAQIENGIYPFFTCDSIPFRINTFAFDTEAIIVSGNGSQVGHVNYYKGKFNAYQRTYVISDFTDVNVQYILHYLKAYLREYIFINSKRGSVPYITMPIIENFKIPIPPLPIQEEIVAILDKFTKLEAELEAELEARKTQYEYYRDELLSFGNENDKIEWKTLGEVLKRNKGTKITATRMKELNKKEGDIKIFAGGKTYAMVNKDDIPKKDIYHIPSIIVKSRGIIEFEFYDKPFSHKSEFWSYYSTSTNINIKFVFYFLQIKLIHFQRVASRMQMPQMSLQDTEKFKIPIPPLSEQERIVAILDKFDALVNDISVGLPAEIEARRKQYEHYREKLLTFPELRVEN